MVGLTGGIGAGKSAAAGRLAADGAVVIDSDLLARQVVEPGTDGLAQVVAAFGEQVLGPDGSLDRPALGRVVFGDAEARRRLEKIVHPLVRAATARRVGQAAADAVVVNDVPLLVEGGMAPSYHLVVVVDADRDVRVQRLARERGMTPADARARIDAQVDDAIRRAAADVVLDNGGPRPALDAAVDALWRDRLVPFETNLRAGRPATAPPVTTAVPYDPRWPADFGRLAARIRHRVGADRRIDHIGSTSVPGMPAMDVIDMQLTVDSLDQADAYAGRLLAAGFPAEPGQWRDKPEPPATGTWDKRLHANADPGRLANLHVRVAGSPGWRTALLLRDFLRSEPAERDAYHAVKLRHAGLPRADYADAEEPWFDAMYERARRWAADTGWTP
jgi:dephospho-CoA kinase